MKVFGDYAKYYNLLYADKEYSIETNFVLSCFKKANCTPKTILDLGCGTGRHALEMSKQGIIVHGVDMSETMLAMGNEMLQNQEFLTYTSLPILHHGDTRNFRLNEKFSAVTSLFHVMSYQNSEEDALAQLSTAYEHLKQGGLFLFDFWYGPGVLTDPPARRERRMEDANTLIYREANPVHRTNDNVVEVHYSISLTDKISGIKTQIAECHNMRYWFLPELRFLAKQAGFNIVTEGAWLEHSMPTTKSWNAYMLVKKVK